MPPAVKLYCPDRLTRRESHARQQRVRVRGDRPTDRTWIESVGEASLPCAGSILLSVLYGRHNYLLSDLLRSAIRRPLKGSPKRGPFLSDRDAEWTERRRWNRAKTFSIPYSLTFVPRPLQAESLCFRPCLGLGESWRRTTGCPTLNQS